MKKMTLLILALAMSFITYAQDEPSTDQNSQTEEEQPKEEKEQTRKYRSISIGLDLGLNLLLGDQRVFEANKIPDINEGRGGFEGMLALNLAKWYTTAWGLQGRMAWMGYSGSLGSYGFFARSFYGDARVMLNLSGIGQRNRSKERRDAWIVSAGLGYNSANAWVYQNGAEKYKLGQDKFPQFINQDERDEKSHNTVMLPFGIQYRVRIGERFDIKIGLDGLWAMDDNLDGSESVVITDWSQNGEPTPRPEVVELAFGNTTNDFLVTFMVGANYWFSFKDHDDPTPIIYADGFSSIEQRLDTIEKNQADLMGDDDNDGVANRFDREPETPEGYKVYGDGTCVDQDRDGICDDADDDPFSTPNAVVDAAGVEMDDDGDAVPNSKDLEPDSKPGAFVNFQGVTIEDKVGSGSEAFLPSIYFDFDKSVVTSANYQRLATIARFLQANPNVNLLVVGHTDPQGAESYNVKLSDRRAKAAMMALVNDFDIDESRIEMEGKGETQLVSKRDDINRRAEFQIKK